MRITLTIRGEEREILRLSYSYYDHSFPCKSFYRSFLEEYFPYSTMGLSSWFPYYRLKKYEPTALDEELMEKAKSRAERSCFLNSSGESGKKEQYYEELTQLRYDHGLDRGIIPNIRDLYAMSPRPSEVPYYKPTGSLGGGLFNVIIDSTEDNDFYYRWLLQATMQEGEFCCYRDGDIVPYFRIRFMDCYCVNIQETTSHIEGIPMLLSMQLSPGVIWNREVEVAKTWRISDSPRPIIPEEVEEEERELLPEVTCVMWKNQEGEEISLIPEEEEKIVTLYVETENCSNGESIKIEIVDDENTILYEYTTNSGKSERIEIKGFDLYQDLRDYAQEKETNPDDIFRMRYTLRAYAINNPGQKQEAIIESEPQCTIHFRRTKDWNGDYFFDWIRTGDTYDTTDEYDIPYHNTKIINDKHSYKENRKIKKEEILINYLSNYETFEQEWRKKYPKYENLSTYYIPCLGIRPDQTVTLRMLLQMEQPSGILIFKVRGTDQLVIESETEFNTNNLYKEATSTSIIQYITPLKIKCNGEIKKTAYIDILAANHLVGQLAILPNPQYKLKAEIVNVIFKETEENGIKKRIFNEIKADDNRILYAKKLLQQLNIELDIKVHVEELNFIDLKETIISESNKEKTSFFIKYYYLNNKIDARSESKYAKKYGIEGSKLELENSEVYNVIDFLFERLKKIHYRKNDSLLNKDWDKKLLIYLFASEGREEVGPVLGKAFRKNNPKAIALFNNAKGQDNDKKEDTTGSNIAHEIIHIFEQDHIFDYPIYFNSKVTDNIMDYIPGNTDNRKTLMKWQYEQIQKVIQINNYSFIEKK